MRLILVRHAQSSGQEPEADLTAEGHAQARALVPRLRDLDVSEVFSSPYRRAVATVSPFAAALGSLVHNVDDLRERKLAEGWLPNFLVHMERSFADENYRLDGGESLAMTTARGLRALAEVALLARTHNPVVASHGNLIASIVRTMDPAFGFAQWQAMRNPHLFEVEWQNGKPVNARELDLTP